jgi:hypothetical protein
MKILFFLGVISLSTVCFAQQIGNGFTQNPYSDSYYIKPSQTALNANVKLKKLPGFEVNIDSLHKGTDLSASEKHKLLMGYNYKSPIGTFNFSAGNTKMPGFVEDKKSLSASYVLKNKWSDFKFSYENNNNLLPNSNKFSDPRLVVSGSFIL